MKREACQDRVPTLPPHDGEGAAPGAPMSLPHPLPALNPADQKKLAALLRKGAVLPMLNLTKWAELIEAMQAAGEQRPQFRLRSVFAVEDFVTAWDGEWYCHIHPVAEIEWLEIRSRSPEWLDGVLRKHGIPFSIEAGSVRVWGYTRPGVQPHWQ